MESGINTDNFSGCVGVYSGDVKWGYMRRKCHPKWGTYGAAYSMCVCVALGPSV